MVKRSAIDLSHPATIALLVAFLVAVPSTVWALTAAQVLYVQTSPELDQFITRHTLIEIILRALLAGIVYMVIYRIQVGANRATTALRVSEERLRRITDNMLDLVSQTDMNGIIQYMTPSHRRVLDYTVEEQLGQSIFSLIHPSDVNTARLALQLSSARPSYQAVELRFRHQDGHYIWLEVTASLLTDQSQKPQGLILASRDISGRHSAQETLTRHARNLTALYDTALAINSQPNITTLLQAIVEQALKLAGTQLGGLYLVQVDGNTLELVANVPPKLEHVVLRIGEGLAGRVARSGTTLVVADYATWDGRADVFNAESWGRVLAVPLKLRGSIIGVLTVEDTEPGVFEDEVVRTIGLLADQAAIAIDNRRLYEQTQHELIERRQIHAALRESESRYRELIENVGEGISFTDVDETFIFANRAAQEIFGLPPERPLAGHNGRDFTDAATFRFIQQQTEIRRTGQVSTYEFSITRADGETRTLLWTARPRYGPNGRFLGVFSVFRDITERQQAEAELRQARNDLAHRNQQLTQILEASHSIRAFLNPDDVLHEIARAAYQSLGFLSIAVNIVDMTSGQMQVRAAMSEDGAMREILLGATYHWQQMTGLMQERYRHGRCYFVPQGEFDWEHDFEGPYYTSQPVASSAGSDAWQPHDTVFVPIELRNGEIVGLIWPDGPVDGRRPSEDTYRLLEIFANQAASAIEHSRLFEAERARRRELEAVYAASQQLTQSLDLTTVLNALLKAALQLVSAHQAALFLYDGQRLSFASALNEYGQNAPTTTVLRENGLTYTVARSGETIFVEDAAQHPLYNLGPTFDPPMLAIASLALRFELTVIGVMNVSYQQPHHFDESERRVLNVLAAQAAIALQNARLHQQVRTYAEDLELRVADRTTELDRQRRRLQAILDSAGEGIQIMDAAGQIEYVNPATTRITGYMVDETIGKTMRLLTSPLNPPAVVNELRQAMSHSRMWEGVVVNERKDGSLYDASVTVTPLTDTYNQLTGFVAVHRDVTRFRELDRLKDLFVSRIGHELRTPVANVKLYLELMERSTADRYPQYIQTLQRETDRLRRLIDGFLEMAQLDAGTQPMGLAPVNLNEILNDLLENQLTNAAARHLTLAAQPALDLPLVLTDRAWLAQAAGKIIDNALFYTPPGGSIVVSTNVCLMPAGTFVTLSVADTGPGIEAVEISHLFERFYRGEAARDFKVPGAGLGLSIAQGLVQQLGGRIAVDSQPGQGATFTIWLPVNTVD